MKKKKTVKSNTFVIVKQKITINKKKTQRGSLLKCLKKVCAKCEVNRSGSFLVTVSTDFENNSYEKKALTSG